MLLGYDFHEEKIPNASKGILLVSLLLVGSLMLAVLGLWSASPAQAQDGCEYTLPPRLSVGGEGQVARVDERPLNVRETPSLYGRQVGSLREGWTFAAREGPVCADFVYWWRIQLLDLDGWIAEGQGAVYFVEPSFPHPPPHRAAHRPTAAPDRHARADLAAESGLVAWDWTAFVGEEYLAHSPRSSHDHSAAGLQRATCPRCHST